MPENTLHTYVSSVEEVELSKKINTFSQSPFTNYLQRATFYWMCFLIKTNLVKNNSLAVQIYIKMSTMFLETEIL